MDLESKFGMMDLIMMVNGIKINLMVVENTFGLTVINMMANGKIIKCMEKVLSHGKMVINIKENFQTIKNMVMEFTLLRMVQLKKVTGLMKSKMEKEFTE